MEKIGGQAVINGVMMKSPGRMAIAVRKGRRIIIKARKLSLWSERLRKWIIIRGVVSLFEMLSLGIKSLNYSADIAAGNEKGKSSSSSWVMAVTTIFALALGIGLFKFLPLLAAQLLSPESYIVFNLIDGLTKIAIFIAYVYAISFFKDIHDVFEYHGAEHKAVNCYEAGKKLTVANAQKFSTVHARCGTSFIFIVLLLSIAVYIFIPKSLPFYMKLLYRLLLLPLIAGMSYEIMKLSAKFSDNPIFSAVSLPGRLIQLITTQEPDNGKVEVAIAALKKVVK